MPLSISPATDLFVLNGSTVHQDGGLVHTMFKPPAPLMQLRVGYCLTDTTDPDCGSACSSCRQQEAPPLASTSAPPTLSRPAYSIRAHMVRSSRPDLCGTDCAPLDLWCIPGSHTATSGYPSGLAAATDVPLAYPICAKAGSAIMFHQATFHGGRYTPDLDVDHCCNPTAACGHASPFTT